MKRIIFVGAMYKPLAALRRFLVALKSLPLLLSKDQSSYDEGFFVLMIEVGVKVDFIRIGFSV